MNDIDRLEWRIAALERRLAELERRPVWPHQPPYQPAYQPLPGTLPAWPALPVVTCGGGAQI